MRTSELEQLEHRQYILWSLDIQLQISMLDCEDELLAVDVAKGLRVLLNELFECKCNNCR